MKNSIARMSNWIYSFPLNEYSIPIHDSLKDDKIFIIDIQMIVGVTIDKIIVIIIIIIKERILWNSKKWSSIEGNFYHQFVMKGIAYRVIVQSNLINF